MTDHPIIFSAPMVRALLDGRKTMTRRLAWKYGVTPPAGPNGAATPWQRVKPGDRLWVRERGWIAKSKLAFVPFVMNEALERMPPASPDGAPYKSVPSIHMPRWASRLTLTVTAVKIERLQEISEADAQAEGVYLHTSWGGAQWYRLDGGPHVPGYATSRARDVFSFLWADLHGNESWHANPEVVVLSFQCEKRNIDAPKGVTEKDVHTWLSGGAA